MDATCVGPGRVEFGSQGLQLGTLRRQGCGVPGQVLECLTQGEAMGFEVLAGVIESRGVADEVGIAAGDLALEPGALGVEDVTVLVERQKLVDRC